MKFKIEFDTTDLFSAGLCIASATSVYYMIMIDKPKKMLPYISIANLALPLVSWYTGHSIILYQLASVGVGSLYEFLSQYKNKEEKQFNLFCESLMPYATAICVLGLSYNLASNQNIMAGLEYPIVGTGFTLGVITSRLINQDAREK